PRSIRAGARCERDPKATFLRSIGLPVRWSYRYASGRTHRVLVALQAKAPTLEPVPFERKQAPSAHLRRKPRAIGISYDAELCRAPVARAADNDPGASAKAVAAARSTARPPRASADWKISRDRRGLLLPRPPTRLPWVHS